MKRRKRTTILYRPPESSIFFTNIVNSNSNMLVILTVYKEANYIPPYTNRFLNVNYLPDVRLLTSEHKLGFDCYVYDVNFTLPNKEDEVTESVIKFLNSKIFFDLDIQN